MIKQFEIGGVIWKVEVDNENLSNENTYGICSYTESKIRIVTTYKGIKRSEESIEQTLLHEVVHGILDTLDYNELSNDEKFVQGFSVLLHQFLKTKK